MRRLLSLTFMFVFLAGLGIYSYTNLDNNYHIEKDFYHFPIPNDVKLESKNEKTRNYIWKPSAGTDVPLGYRLMIKKSGWKQIKTEGSNFVYKKDNQLIHLTFNTDHIEVVKDSK